MNVRPAGREACSCASPYNSILERLTAMEAEILTAMQEANTAVGIANTALAQVQAAGIRTVNQIQPDADGDFSISAGTGIQINAGTNGIEIEAAITPEEWDGPYKVGNALNPYFDENGNLTNDVIISLNEPHDSRYTYTPIGGTTYFPKGTNEYTLFCFTGVYTPYRVCYYVTTLHNLRTRNDAMFFYGSGYYLNLANTSGSGINQTLDLKLTSMTQADGGYRIYIKKAVE